MKTRATWMAMVAMAAAIGGCRKSPQASPSPAAPVATPAADTAAPPRLTPNEAPPPTAAPNTMPAGQSRINVHVGIGGDTENGVSTGQTGFPVGSSVTAAVDVSVQAAGSVVKATWRHADGATLGEAHQTVTAGQRWMLFVAPSTGWSEGAYQVDVVSSGGGSATRPFQIEPRQEEQPTPEPG